MEKYGLAPMAMESICLIKRQTSLSSIGGDANNNTLAGKNIFTMCDYGDFLIVGVHEGKLLKFNKRKKHPFGDDVSRN